MGLSCRFTTGAVGLPDTDRRHVKLPRIGLVRTHESTRKLARHIERGTGRVRSATVTHQGGRWFCSFSVEVERHDPAPARPDSVVGVDLGVTSLAVLSTEEVIANPRHLEVALKELRRLQRQACRRVGPDQRTRQVPSQRWRKTQARIAKLHTAVANARRDGLHQLTTRLVRKHATIVIENLRRRRDAPQPAPRPPRRRCRLGRTPPPDRVQNQLGRWPRRGRGPLVPLLQDLFGLWRGESQTAPVRTDVSLR